MGTVAHELLDENRLNNQIKTIIVVIKFIKVHKGMIVKRIITN